MAVNTRGISIRRKTLGTDELVNKIINEPESPEAALYMSAKAINDSSLKRGYVEASLLASDNLNEIADVLEMSVNVLGMYRDIFFDVKDFDKLSKLELLSASDPKDVAIKTWALSQGLSFIAWRLGKKVDISPIEGLQELFTTCMYKAKEAMFSGNTSDASKESTKWVKLSLDIARLLKLWVLDSAAAKKDIELALREVIPNFGSIADLDLGNDEILNEAKEAPTDEIKVGVEIEFESIENILNENT